MIKSNFALPKNFVDGYRNRPAPFGFGALSELTYLRTYSRSDNPNTPTGQEAWADTCERVVNGMYKIQHHHAKELHRKWNSDGMMEMAKTSYDLLFNIKWTPPGRGLWMMGTPFVMERMIPEALQNCAFLSTQEINGKGAAVFGRLMELSMLGVGVGFDTRGSGQITIVPRPSQVQQFVIEDSREGWASSVVALIDSFLGLRDSHPFFDYSKIRPKGAKIVGFGGIASGPEPLMLLHKALEAIFINNTYRMLSSRMIVDIANLIGRCVISGNVRRSAEIALGFPEDQDFINLKNYEINPERAEWGWVSNNSVIMEPEAGVRQYDDIAHRIYDNGEPGVYWLENAQKYGRMNGKAMFDNAIGANPCMEQNLADGELCTLSEVFLPRCSDRMELYQATKHAFIYAKTATLLNRYIKDDATREIMTKNMRMGVSMTGISQFTQRYGKTELTDAFRKCYDLVGEHDTSYSHYFEVNEAIRMTSVKPSGTISLLGGVTPGIHNAPAGRFHLRRVALASNSHLIDPLEAAGYTIEPSSYDSDSVFAIFPIDMGPDTLDEREVSVGQQLDLIEIAQEHWADNSVSATVKFDPKVVKPHDIADALSWSETRLKAISFLPTANSGYTQMPYEALSEQEYGEMMNHIKGVPDFSGVLQGGAHAKLADSELFCDGDSCLVGGA